MIQNHLFPDLQNPGLYLKVADVARIAQVSLSQVYALVKNGSLKAVKFGAAIRIRQEDLEEFVQSNLTTHGA
jgi:excisionase family DNA binding protein